MEAIEQRRHPTLGRVALVSLPVQLGEGIDQKIQGFLARHQDARAHLRWHGADLWMVFVDEEVMGGTATRRVTVAAFSDAPDELVFIPDLVLTKGLGRYVLAEEDEGDQHTRVVQRSIFNLMQPLYQNDRNIGMRRLQSNLANALGKAWRNANTIQLEAATVLLP